MKIKFENKNHRYELGGRHVPSLSSILDFYFGEFQDFTNGTAADKGTKVHRACELYAQGRLDESSLTDDFAGYLSGFKKFYKQHWFSGKPVCELKTYITSPQELSDYDEKNLNWLGCGMRLDMVFRQERVVVEIKTGIPAQNRFFGFSREDMQLNTQLKAMESRRKPVNTWRGFLLYLKKNGEYRAIEKAYSPNIWTHFLCAWNGWYNYNKEK